MICAIFCRKAGAQFHVWITVFFCCFLIFYLIYHKFNLKVDLHHDLFSLGDLSMEQKQQNISTYTVFGFIACSTLKHKL